MKTRADKFLTRISYGTLFLLSMSCILPFLLLISGSLTDNNTIVASGYTFIPKKWSADAYHYLWATSKTLVRAYGITIGTTVIGTIASLFITSMIGYGLSFRDLPGIRILSFFVIFTLLFNGGLVPSYMVYTQIFHIKNTIWAQLIPGLLMNGFTITLMRTYFSNTIPPSIKESARVDGAGEFRIFIKIIMPLSLPMMATIGLLNGVSYWNSWANGLYYLTKTKFYNVQNILNKMLTDIRFLQSGAAGDYGTEQLIALPANSVRMAMAVIGVIPILLLYPFFQKYFVKGITVGAVKE